MRNKARLVDMSIQQRYNKGIPGNFLEPTLEQHTKWLISKKKVYQFYYSITVFDISQIRLGHLGRLIWLFYIRVSLDLQYRKAKRNCSTELDIKFLMEKGIVRKFMELRASQPSHWHKYIVTQQGYTQ